MGQRNVKESVCHRKRHEGEAKRGNNGEYSEGTLILIERHLFTKKNTKREC